MKKIISILLCTFMVLSVAFALPITAGAEQADIAQVSFVTEDKIAYNILPDGTAEFCAYLGEGARLTIPSEIDGHTVTSIAYRGLEANHTLEQIIIPYTVERIGEYSFLNYTNLVDIIIPESVTFIGTNAFSGTAWINTFADGPIYINNVLYAYAGEMEANTHFEVMDGTVSISDSAFYNERGLTSISIPNTVEYIGVDAFFGCPNLESVNIPASVTYIDSYTFAECSKLKSIVVDENNPVYDSRENCNAIIETATNTLIKGCDNTVVPQSVCAIGDKAFYYCENLSCVHLSENVKSIGDMAFYSCKNLSDVEIKADSVNIGMIAFGDTPFYDNLPMGENYINNTFLLYKGDMPKNCEYTLKEGVKSIAPSAFKYQTNLVSVTLPQSLEYIGASAFYGCKGLVNVDIKDNVRVIDDSAFSTCTSLESFDFPEKLELIGNGAFYMCSNTVFSGELSNAKSLGDYAFGYCDKLSKAEFSADDLYIGSFAFSDCVSLTDVVFNGTVKNIDYSAFNNCIALIEIAVDAECITFDAFIGCDALEAVYLYNPICNMPYELTTHTFMRATIYGYDDSSAQAFCKYYGKKFVSLGKAPLKGDVDSNGELSIMDATYIQLYLANRCDFDDTQKKLADADNDSDITIMDVTHIQFVLAKII
ncbi:MAG: leucine-rich repeat protein [Ruminococcus sp.]|nr:leucine-rich repeat protein [Ruminococcus sp.]